MLDTIHKRRVTIFFFRSHLRGNAKLAGEFKGKFTISARLISKVMIVVAWTAFQCNCIIASSYVSICFFSSWHDHPESPNVCNSGYNYAIKKLLNFRFQYVGKSNYIIGIDNFYSSNREVLGRLNHIKNFHFILSYVFIYKLLLS